MRTVWFRVLSSIFLCFIPAFAVAIILLLKGPELLIAFGIAKYDGGLVSTFAVYPSSFIFVALWQRYVLKVAFPPPRQAFLHPRNLSKIWAVKLLFGLEGLVALLMYSNYGNSVTGLISVSIVLASMYGFVVISEIMLHMAKDPRVWHPLRQE